MPIRILIADDHGLLRAGLRALLRDEPDMAVVGEAIDSEDAIRKALELRPDVILLDISMPGQGGLEVTRFLRKNLPGTRILILTVHEDEGLLREAIRLGASGYIIKRAVEAELVHAIRAVWRGELYIHPAMTRALLRDLAPPPPEVSPVEPLTPRELEVLRRIALGYTNRQIAEELGISIRTVETHRANLMGKLGVNSRVELVRYAREHGLI
ncbi:response regulator transcription factor [Thermoflexus sp.]|jgi:DNA-binding NarL/FixJ family response regulator|uniref:response regulator n=1 Tax=Thermoflexus sp. TaxID=1969742 RepID=UPI00260D778C|nr:response regulator transcription factor [Thermoflexus sp.]